MSAVLALGLVIGMRHALEADHVAAVASLATGARTVGATVRLGAAWGLGHGLTLLAVSGTVLLAGGTVSETVGRALEGAVGLMLVALGADVLVRLVRREVHFHIPRHRGAHGHPPARARAGEPAPRRRARSGHRRPQGTEMRALLVGLVHGLAGSGALVLLALGEAPSALAGVAYVVLFGLGSVLGMAALSLAIAWPMRGAARRLSGARRWLDAAVGLGTLALGVRVIAVTVLGPGA